MHARVAPVVPERLGLLERSLGVDSVRRVAVRRKPCENERDAVTGFHREVGDRVEVLADEPDRCREDERVRPRDGNQPVLGPPDPRHDRAVVEADRQVHIDRDASFDALDDSDDVRRLAARRHEVDQANRPVGRVELGLEDHRGTPVPPPGVCDLRLGAERPVAVLRVAEQLCEARPRVETGEARPVDRPVSRDERGRLQVADQAVVLDPLSHRG